MTHAAPHSHALFGVGLRTRHYSHLQGRPPTRVDWFEAISENYMHSEGRPMQVLETVRRDYPVALHGVSLSIASPDGVDPAYLQSLRSLVERIQPFVVSDHLCFSRYRGDYLHDLIPFPCTGEALDVVCRNVDVVQRALGRRLALENASVYLAYPDAEMSEAEFLSRVVERTGAGVLLDLNNLYVNLRNVGNDPFEYFERIPEDAVLQMHLAGYSDLEQFFFDTHSAPVYAPVWDLFAKATELYPRTPVCIEWDEAVPEFSVLEEELEKARRIRRQVVAGDLTAKDRIPEERMQTAGREPARDHESTAGHEPTTGRRSPSIRLDDVQRSFRDLLFSGAVESFPVRIRPAGELEAGDALDVYAQGYLARREEAVLENHRGTAWLLGAPLFYEITHDYLRGHFSREFDLNRFGRDFGDYLRERADSPLLSLAGEMARLDRAYVDVFHRAAGSFFDPGGLESLEGREDLRLILHPSLELLSLNQRVYDLWKERDAVSLSSRPGIGSRNPGDFGGFEGLALYRRDGQVVILRLQPWQLRLLEDLKSDGLLLPAVHRLSESYEGSAREFERYFARLVREKIIAGVETSY